MKMKKYLLIILLLLGGVTAVYAQGTVTIRLNRDFGAGFGTQIQGRFSFRVDAPEAIQRVEFFIDDQLIGFDDEAPFRFQFETGQYPVGLHSLTAIGYSEDGESIPSNTLQREFISGSDSTQRAIYIVVPLILLAIGGRVLSSYIANRNRKESDHHNVHGPLGGTICPNCNKPYAIHLWSPQFVTFRIDRCPHCGKWRSVKRMPTELLDAAVDALMEQEKNTAVSPKPPTNDQALDDSKFID